MNNERKKELAGRLKQEWLYYQAQNEGLTQREFAEKLGYTQSMLSQMINGHLEVPFKQAWQLARIFKLDFQHITERYYNGSS